MGDVVNSDIRLSVDFFDHPKTLKLERRLGSDGVAALIRLWCFAAKHRPDGNLSNMDAEDIELASKYKPTSVNGSLTTVNGVVTENIFVTTLVDLRWLDVNEDGVSFSLHDWKLHNAYASESETRGDAARFSRLASINRDAYEALKAGGYNAITSEQYKEFTKPKRPPIPVPSDDGCEVVNESLTVVNVSSTPAPAPAPAFKTFSSSGDEVVADDFFLTKKKRKLSGKRLESFNLFWDAFDYKSGKAEAADVWLDIPQLTGGLVLTIIAAAKKEADARKTLVAEGKTPKMAQGWLSGRRWEDEKTLSLVPPKPTSEGNVYVAPKPDPAIAATRRAMEAAL